MPLVATMIITINKMVQIGDVFVVCFSFLACTSSVSCVCIYIKFTIYIFNTWCILDMLDMLNMLDMLLRIPRAVSSCLPVDMGPGPLFPMSSSMAVSGPETTVCCIWFQGWIFYAVAGLLAKYSYSIYQYSQ